MGINLEEDKVMSLTEAASLVADDDRIAIGGVLMAREPIGMLRELIRSEKKGLHAIGPAHSFGVDLMCAAKIVKTVEHSYVGFEFDFGLALNYRRACETGAVEVKETDCNILNQQLRAAQFGIPFMPMPSLTGTDLQSLHPEYKTITCPFTGENLTLVPAMKIDVAIIHAHKADRKGNIKLIGPEFKDRIYALTAGKVIITTEEIVGEDEMIQLGPSIPYYNITAVVKVPFGAHPTSFYPEYAYDRQHLQEYVELSRDDAAINRYLDKYVFNISEAEEYLAAIGGDRRLELLRSFKRGTTEWMEVFQS